jgi:hypothetical protein
MTTFHQANQIRLSLKMKFSKYSWYDSSLIANQNDGYAVIIMVRKIDGEVKKLISPVVNGVSIRTEIIK